MHAHTYSPGALRYTSDRSLSLRDCLEHCNALSGSLLAGACLAVDVEFIDDDSSSTVVCWLHTDLARLTKKYRHAGVIQYVIVRCPQQQGRYIMPYLCNNSSVKVVQRYVFNNNNNNNNN